MGERYSTKKNRVGLPPRPFLYTLDQIAALLNVSEADVRKYVWYDGRHVGVPDRERVLARNIATPESKPEWRVSERELVRWMRVKGFRYYENSYFS